MATPPAAALAVADALPVLPPAKEIPSGFVSSLKSWWAAGEKESAAAEERLLRQLPFYQPSNSSRVVGEEQPAVASRSRVDLNTPKHYINTLSIKSTSPSPNAPPPAVMLHGYGAGLGFYFRNFQAMANWAGKRGTDVYALDWLGMGRSARVPFTVKAKREDIPGRVAEAEAFFIDSLEEWRAKMGLEKMTLVGHSLGAYFSVVYALKYPTRVNKLILLSPAGVPHDPNGTTMPSREVTDSPVTEGSDSDHPEPATLKRVKTLKDEQKAQKRQESRTRKLFTYLWEEGWSPFQVVRSTLFWGPMLVGKYSSRRFSGLTDEETRNIHDYIMNITLAKGSGEYCISHILAPGAHARIPLVDRVAALKIPVTFVYGDQDWMDPQGGTDSVENLRKAGNGNGRMYIVPHAGHHVYLDNPKVTSDLIVKELDRPID
ncbi:alpha/beta-hydrolase [Neolentinus lepideus HHB14362 ss-1]|uniref:Alpha/beta-hydrolase n=1 Tax=Neolentinus lepideus HHB14362 ss-1 TaxID=1314782 RepID=A0A165TQI1_9AGAM|nr:alpha/beta-hydrolase [Neolentinus lepideus HHB14362 ss-1]